MNSFRTLGQLGIPRFCNTRLVYKVWPDAVFYPLWAFQNQKTIRNFVAITGGDEYNQRDVLEAALMLWEKDPEAVEERMN